MQRIIFLITTIVLFYQFGYVQAQQAVKGVVIGNGGEALEYINVVARSLPDSTFIAGVVTNREGAFSFESLPKNSCLSFSSNRVRNFYLSNSRRDEHHPKGNFY